MLYPPFKKLRSSVRPSVWTSARPSAHRFYSAGSILQPIFFELAMRGIVKELQMGKFWQISTELRPLIDVRNLFSLSIFGIS